MTNHDSLINNGVIDYSEFLNLKIFKNLNYSNFVNFYNDSIGINDGTINFSNFTNADLFNNTNNLLGHDMLNKGNFYNESDGEIILADNFSNIDTAYNDAKFIIEGKMYVSSDFYNRDTLSGTNGSICVVQSSSNKGQVLGSFDFCDQLTLDGHFEFNSGYISPNLTYCQSACKINVKEKQIESLINVFPNPADEFIKFDFGKEADYNITILNSTGKTIYKGKFSDRTFVFNKSELASGMYFFMINSDNNSYSGKFIFR